MKTVAVLLAASLSVVLAACGTEEPAPRAATTAPTAAAELAGEAEPQRLAMTNDANAPVRDAREAAGDAAKRIFDATVGAASKLRQSVSGDADEAGTALAPTSGADAQAGTDDGAATVGDVAADHHLADDLQTPRAATN